jgi:hypothetical protein
MCLTEKMGIRNHGSALRTTPFSKTFAHMDSGSKGGHPACLSQDHNWLTAHLPKAVVTILLLCGIAEFGIDPDAGGTHPFDYRQHARHCREPLRLRTVCPTLVDAQGRQRIRFTATRPAKPLALANVDALWRRQSRRIPSSTRRGKSPAATAATPT